MIQQAYVKVRVLHELALYHEKIIVRAENEPYLLKNTIELALQAAEEFECNGLSTIFRGWLKWIKESPEKMTNEQVNEFLKIIIERNITSIYSLYVEELEDRFLCLDKEGEQFFRNKGQSSFEPDIFTRYPTIEKDIRAAGRAFATATDDDYTACAFHLGRATEIVMQDLAKRRRISLYHPKQPHKARFKRAWGPLLSKLQEHLDKGKIKSEKIRTEYNSALIVSRRLKDIRNNTDHPSDLQSESYKKEDALLIWQLTKQFIEHAARTFVKKD